MKFQKTVLKNGLRLLCIPMPSFESATVLVMVGAGSRYETKKNNGISHFLEHMAFKGTEKRPSALDITSLIDGMGGEFNAFTGKETTGYYVKSAAANIEISIDVMSDMLSHSKLDAKEIEKEKGVILEEINLYEDTPSRRIGDVYERLLYGDSPMGWHIDGEKEIIKSIVREDFKKYMSSLYSASNMTVVVAGGVGFEQTQKLIEKYFGKMSKFDALRYSKVIENQKNPTVYLRQKKTEQMHLAIGFRTVPLDHKDRYGLSLLASILGGGMSSRLFHEVREKRGLGYYVRTSSDEYQDCGSLVSFAGVDPKRTEEAITVILEQYRGISNFPSSVGRQFPISNEELKKAKEYLKGHLVLELEDSRSVAGYYAAAELLEKKIESPEELIKKTDAVTTKEIQKIAQKYLINDTLNLAAIGNFEAVFGSEEQALQKVKKLLHL